MKAGILRSTIMLALLPAGTSCKPAPSPATTESNDPVNRAASAGNSTADAAQPAAVRAAFSNPQAYASIGPSVARIEFDGELYNGEHDLSTGSGFLISREGYVLTCKHVIPKTSNYRRFQIVLRFGAKTAPAREATVEWSDQKLDLIVLKIARPTPAIVRLADALLAPGHDIAVIGFPVSFELNVTNGIVAGPSGDGRYVINAPINPGYSGAPVIGPDGKAVGVAWGAAHAWDVGGKVLPVHNAGFFIPMVDVLAALPDRYRGSDEPFLANVAGVSRDLPYEMRRAETILFTKDDHPVALGPHRRRYEKILSAEPGYEIIGTSVATTSINHATPLVVEVEGGKAIVSSELTSGSAVDRWRGWLVATVELHQRRKIPSGNDM